jgi:hypothetical protein
VSELPILPQPPKGVELPFDVVREGWSIYKVTKDGVTLRMKLIVMKILVLAINEEGAAYLAAGSNVVVTSKVPENVKGTPSDKDYTPEEIVRAIVEPEVEFETVREDWNEYDTEGTKIGLKVVATVISKTNLCDRDGDPIYNTQYQIVLRSVSTPQDKEKFLKMKREKSLPNPPS